MARYKPTDNDLKFIPIDLREQLIPGSFEHTLNYLLDCELDLRHFDLQFNNNERGAPAYAPRVLLKIILFAYSRGINTSRGIERACRENVVFMALSGDSTPHFTTIAGFIRHAGQDIERLFSQVLAICDRQGLIGRDMFAIDGVKLPSNAAKSKSEAGQTLKSRWPNTRK